MYRRINLGGDQYSLFVAIADVSFLPPERLEGIHEVQGMRAVGVNPIDENDVAPEDKDDFSDLPTIGDIPADKDVEEGEEEKDDDFDLPPAMPPAV
jgi:hypothetical protein